MRLKRWVYTSYRATSITYRFIRGKNCLTSGSPFLKGPTPPALAASVFWPLRAFRIPKFRDRLLSPKTPFLRVLGCRRRGPEHPPAKVNDHLWNSLNNLVVSGSSSSNTSYHWASVPRRTALPMAIFTGLPLVSYSWINHLVSPVSRQSFGMEQR